MKCEAMFCDRDAVLDVAGRHLCDECYLAEANVYFESRKSFWERHPRLRMTALVLYLLFTIGGAVCFTIAMLRLSTPT